MGCTSKGPISAYVLDRAHDFGDIPTLTLGYGIGAKANVGPLYANIGFHYQVERWGWRYGALLREEGRQGGLRGSDGGGLWFAGSSTFSPTKWQRRRGKEFAYAATGFPFLMTPNDNAGPAYWTEIEVAFGLGPAVRVGLNPGEAVDFLAGLLKLDPFGDDVESSTPSESSGGDKAPEAAPKSAFPEATPPPTPKD